MRKRAFGPFEFYKRALLIGLPIMAQGLIQNLVSLIDSFMVSGLGDVKMSGVNISGQIMFVFMVLLSVICTTGGIFMTQFHGANNKRGMRQSLTFKILIAAVCMIGYFLACMVFPRQVLSLMVVGNAQSEAILDVGERYLYLMGFNGIPVMISTIIASSLRETGQVRVPLIISVTATLINTFLNWILIYGNLGAPRLEVAGAAYATIVARCAEMLMYCVYIRRVKQPFAIGLKDLFHIDAALFVSILKKGGLLICSEMLWSISDTITSALYNSRGGADVVSGMAASFSIANLFFVAFGGICTATSILLGRSLGAGKLDKAREEKRWLLSAAIVFGFMMMLVGISTCLLVPVVFSNLSASSQSICRSMVFWMALLMPAWVYANTQVAIARSGGDAMMGMVADVVTIGGMVLPGVFLLTKCTPIGPVAIYVITKGVVFIKIAMNTLWLKKERWVKNLAVEHEG